MEFDWKSLSVVIGVGLVIEMAGMTFMQELPILFVIPWVLVVTAIAAGIALGAGFLLASITQQEVGYVGIAYLKFAAAYAVLGAVNAWVPCSGGLIGLAIFMGCLMWLFEYEWWEALIMSIAIGVVNLGLAFMFAVVAAGVLAAMQ